MDLDSISAGDVLQSVNKTRVKGPGKTLPGKYIQNKVNCNAFKPLFQTMLEASCIGRLITQVHGRREAERAPG